MSEEVERPEPPEPVARALAEALAAERLRIVAALIRTTGDWDLAEDAVGDAAERALQRWPRDGVPDNPAAWLTTTARRRATDLIRRAATERAKLSQLAADELRHDSSPPDTDMTFGHDDRLRLIFTCAHPALALEARVALTLKVVAGLSTEAVARAFLTTEATMSQRLLRAKRRIAHAGIPYRVPDAAALPERLDGVLATLYLIFTSGYAPVGRGPGRGGDPAGPAAHRPDAGLRRDPGPARPDAAAARPPRRPDGRRRAGHAGGAGPLPLGRRDDRRGARAGPRPDGPGALPAAGRAGGGARHGSDAPPTPTGPGSSGSTTTCCG